MIYRSKAPLRIGLAGGGTDVSPYSDLYGGAILNATVSLYAYANIEITESEEVHFESIDYKTKQIISKGSPVEFNGVLDLHKGVYDRIQKTISRNACRVLNYQHLWMHRQDPDWVLLPHWW